MLKLSQRDIRQGYRGVKHLAQRAAKKGDYEQAQEYVRHCATIAQQFNWIYSDLELEDLLCQIAEQTLPGVPSPYEVNSNRVVLYDDFCTSFVLALQYVKALVAAGKEILYITHDVSKKGGKFVPILDTLRNFPNVTIVQISGCSLREKQQQIQQVILDFHPSQLLLHMYAHSSVVPVLYRLPKAIKSYIINLADQTFWLGAKAVDYVLEFRQFGVSVSQQRRGIRPDQQLLIPFYPIVDNNPFQGFPPECTAKDKVLIFSGGDIYKVLDEKRMYWHLVKELLDRHPNVVFLYATKINTLGTSIIEDFIQSNHFEGRFIYTPFRPDINEVLAHADIYMGTCPASGSLMSQLAARNATPILQYYYPGTPDDETEQAICVNEQFPISFQTEEAFLEEADRLIHDVGYRHAQGERLQRAMISEEQFNALVRQSLATNQTQLKLQPFTMDYQLLDERWLALEKQGYISSIAYLYGLLRPNMCFRYSARLFLKKNINRILIHLSK